MKFEIKIATQKIKILDMFLYKIKCFCKLIYLFFLLKSKLNILKPLVYEIEKYVKNKL